MLDIKILPGIYLTVTNDRVQQSWQQIFRNWNDQRKWSVTLDTIKPELVELLVRTKWLTPTIIRLVIQQNIGRKHKTAI